MSEVPAPAPGIRTVLGPDKDPRVVMRSIAKFASENRGVAEIRDGGKLIGYVVLCKAVERVDVAIYDCATRAIEHMPLVGWLQARGYEASACRWEEIDPFMSTRSYIDGAVRWKLVTNTPGVPRLPSEFPVRVRSEAEQRARVLALAATIREREMKKNVG